MRGRLRSTKWLVVCIVAGFVAALAWITFEDLGIGGSQASRAAAIAYGTVSRNQSEVHLVIDEIWKAPASGGDLVVGDSIPLHAPSDSSVIVPDKAVVFFTYPVFRHSGHLQIGSIAYVHNGTVGSSKMPVAEFKKMCLATPGT